MNSMLTNQQVDHRPMNNGGQSSQLSQNKKPIYQLAEDSEDDIDLGSDEDEDEDFGNNLYINSKTKQPQNQQRNQELQSKQDNNKFPEISKSATAIRVVDHTAMRQNSSTRKQQDYNAPKNETQSQKKLQLNDNLSDDDFYHNESLNASKQIQNQNAIHQQQQQAQIKSALQNQNAQNNGNISTKNKHPIQLTDNSNISGNGQPSLPNKQQNNISNMKENRNQAIIQQQSPTQSLISDTQTHGGDDEEPYKGLNKNTINTHDSAHLEDLRKYDPPNFGSGGSNDNSNSKANNLDGRRLNNQQANNPANQTKFSQQSNQSQQPSIQDSESVERMAQINEKLKQELHEVINKMETQLKRFEDKRRAKIESDLQTNTAMIDKNQKIRMGQKKFQRIKQEVQEMWAQLEHSYNIELINKLEDELKDKTNRMTSVREEVNSVQKIEKEQNGALDNLNRNKENSDKISNLSNQLREHKDEYKKLKELSLQDQKLLKQQHEQKVRLEEKCKKIQKMITDSKNKNTTQRSNAPNQMVTDFTKQKLEDEVKEMEEQKLQQEKKLKSQVSKLDKQLKQLNHELQILSIKLKEKDQEVKLSDLKIKELKNQVPNTKLKPLRRGDASKVNMSVDTRLNDQFDSLIDEDRMSSKRGGNNIRPNNAHRKIIRDNSQKTIQKVNSSKNQISQPSTKASQQSKSRPANQRPQTITRQNSTAGSDGKSIQAAPKQFNIRNSKNNPVLKRKNSNTSQLSHRSKSGIPNKQNPQNSKPNADILGQLNLNIDSDDQRSVVQDEQSKQEHYIYDDGDNILESQNLQAQDDQIYANANQNLDQDDKLLHTIHEEISQSQFELPSQMPRVKNMQKPLSRPHDIIDEEDQIQEDVNNMSYAQDDFEQPLYESRTGVNHINQSSKNQLNLHESSIRNDVIGQSAMSHQSFINDDNIQQNSSQQSPQTHKQGIDTAIGDSQVNNQQQKQGSNNNVFAKPSFMMKKKR
eukprot:403346307